MASLFQSVINSFKRFPGIGQRLAERMAFHVLEMEEREVAFISQTIVDFKKKIKTCSVCSLISEYDPCRICRSRKRDRSLICVVKNVQDAFRIERSASYKGLYHVLGGLVSPVHNISETDLRIAQLYKRIQAGVNEIIFAFEQNIEAEATIKTILRGLDTVRIKTSRLAIGIPSGTGLEYLDEDTLTNAMKNRFTFRT